jgi:hypothetical protein
MRQLIAFAFGVPLDINGFHPSTQSSINLSHPQSFAVPRPLSMLSMDF